MSNKIDLALMPKQITVLCKDEHIYQLKLKNKKNFILKVVELIKIYIYIYIYRFGGIG